MPPRFIVGSEGEDFSISNPVSDQELSDELNVMRMVAS